MTCPSARLDTALLAFISWPEASFGWSDYRLTRSCLSSEDTFHAAAFQWVPESRWGEHDFPAKYFLLSRIHRDLSDNP